MNPRPSGIPLRPDPHAVERDQRRALVRTLTAVALGGLKKRSAEEILSETWPKDANAAVLTRGAIMPTSTTSSGLVMPTAIEILPSLAPQSAAARLFAQAGLKLDFAGVNQYSIPHIGSMPVPVFVGEGLPAPVVQPDLDATVCGPTKKLMFITGISGTLENYSVQAASGIIGKLMADSAGLALDAAVFSNVPGDAVRPPGLLFGTSPVVATAGGGIGALVGDLQKLISKIADAKINTDNIVIVANPQQALTLRLLPPQPLAAVYSTIALPVGSVIAVVPDAVVTGYEGTPQIYTSKQALVHFEDTTPANIGVAGAPNIVSAPSLSSYQNDLLLLKLRMRLAWGVRSGAIQYVESATW